VTQIEVLGEYGASLATKANELTHKLKPKEAANVAFFESSYLLVYLTLRPLREQWNLVGTEQTTLTLDKARYWLLREVVCAVMGVSSDAAKLTDRQRDEVNTLTTNHEVQYELRQSTYDRLPVPGDAFGRDNVLVKFLEYIQTRIGRTFDDQELLALFLAYLTALSSLDSHHFVNELLKVRQ